MCVDMFFDKLHIWKSISHDSAKEQYRETRWEIEDCLANARHLSTRGMSCISAKRNRLDPCVHEPDFI